MITTLVFAGSTTTKLEDVDEISDHVGRPNTLVWVDLVEATDDDLRCLQDEFSLHPLALEDVREYGQRPKLELYPTHAFIIGYAHDADSADLPEVDMFVGPNWLITARSHNERGELFDIIPVRERYERLRGDSSGVGLLLSAIFRDMVDGYFDTVEASEDRLEAIEHRLFDRDDVDPAQAARADRDVEGLAPDLLHLRRELIVLRRKIVPLRDVVLGIIRREIPWVEDSSIVFFQDVLDHLLRVLDQIDTQRELLGNVVDANLGLIANRTNDVMKKTSSWGAILICATLVAGIYGMNFDNMPELNWRFGYFGALATMAALTAGLYLYFKRKTWL